jgi:hypothetical protein
MPPHICDLCMLYGVPELWQIILFASACMAASMQSALDNPVLDALVTLFRCTAVGSNRCIIVNLWPPQIHSSFPKTMVA